MSAPESAFPALQALKWKTTAWPGIRLHFLGQGTAANRAVLIAMDPHCAYPRHRHLGDEEVFVLAGSYHDAAGEYRAGEFLLNPAGSSHAAVAGPSGALLFARVPEGIEVLESSPERA